MTWHNRADGAPAPPHPGPPSRWPADSLGESLVLVGDLENRRAELEERFPPLANPRAGTTDRAATCRDHRHCPPCRDSRRRTLEEPARPGRSPPRAGSRCALGGPTATGQNPSPTTPSKYSWTTDGAPQSSTPLQLDLRGSLRLRRGARRNLYHRARPAHPGPTVGAHPNPGAPPHLPGRLPQRTGTDPTGQQPGKRPLLCRRCSVTEPPRIDRVQDQT
jgi:hypothetical protein